MASGAFNQGGVSRVVTRRGKGGEIARSPNDCGGAEKSQQCRKYFLQQHICFQKSSGSNMGAPNLLLAPGAI